MIVTSSRPSLQPLSMPPEWDEEEVVLKTSSYRSFLYPFNTKEGLCLPKFSRHFSMVSLETHRRESSGRGSVSFLNSEESDVKTNLASFSKRFSVISLASNPSTILGEVSTHSPILFPNEESCRKEEFKDIVNVKSSLSSPTQDGSHLTASYRGFFSEESMRSNPSNFGGLVKKESKAIQDLPSFASRFIDSGEMIGEGSFGVVFLGYDTFLKRTFAIKKMAKNQIDIALQEWENGCLMFNNSHIPKTYGLYKDDQFLYLVQEWVNGKDLACLIKEKGTIPEPESLYIFREIVKALVDLHAKGILHRDIKPGNILIENQGRVWLIDLGSSSSSTLRRRTSFVGTPAFMAPEIRDESYDEKADIWSLGVLLFYMLTKEVPFPGVSSFRVSDYKEEFVLTEERGLLLRNRASEQACHLIHQMFEVDPRKRLSLAAVLQHPLLQKESRPFIT